MRKLILAIFAVALAAATGRADVIFSDSFDSYPTGQLGGNDGWSGSNSHAQVQNAVTFNGSNAVQLTSWGGHIYWPSTPYASQTFATPVNADAIYISFKVCGVGLDSDYDDVALAMNGNGGLMRVGYSYDTKKFGNDNPVVYAMADGGSMNYVTYSTSNNTDYLVVAKLWKSTPGATSYYDRFTIWLDPQFLDETANGPGITSVGSNDMISTITGFSLGGDLTTSGKSVYYDDLAFTTTFAEAVPEPGTIGLMLAGTGGLLLAGRRMRASQKTKNNW